MNSATAKAASTLGIPAAILIGVVGALGFITGIFK